VVSSGCVMSVEAKCVQLEPGVISRRPKHDNDYLDLLHVHKEEDVNQAKHPILEPALQGHTCHWLCAPRQTVALLPLAAGKAGSTWFASGAHAPARPFRATRPVPLAAILSFVPVRADQCVVLVVGAGQNQ
jgi:hypothetical protein